MRLQCDRAHAGAVGVKGGAERVQASGKWRGAVVTEIVPATEFWEAEDYHQDYLEKNPGGYSCHYLRD